MSNAGEFTPILIVVDAGHHPNITVAPGPGVLIVAPAQFDRRPSPASIDLAPALKKVFVLDPSPRLARSRPGRDWEQRRAPKHRRGRA